MSDSLEAMARSTTDAIEKLERLEAALRAIVDNMLVHVSEDVLLSADTTLVMVQKELAALRKELGENEKQRMRIWKSAWHYADRLEMRIP